MLLIVSLEERRENNTDPAIDVIKREKIDFVSCVFMMKLVGGVTKNPLVSTTSPSLFVFFFSSVGVSSTPNVLYCTV